MDVERDRKRKNCDEQSNQNAIEDGEGRNNDVDCSLTLGLSSVQCNSSSTLDPQQTKPEPVTLSRPPPPPPYELSFLSRPPPSLPFPPPPPPPPPPYNALYLTTDSNSIPQSPKLELLFSSPPPSPPSRPPQPPPLPQPPFNTSYHANHSSAVAPRPLRTRRNPTQAPRNGKAESIPPPYPWATDQRATVHSLQYLLSRGILEIEGEAQCRRCEVRQVMKYDLVGKFREVALFISARKDEMHTRAPPEWMNPEFPECPACAQPNCMRPVLAEKKRQINWLFMLLGQSLGCCTLQQLKYFCKHSKNHRTGAKDRVLYLAYLGLCKQLDPAKLFDP